MISKIKNVAMKSSLLRTAARDIVYGSKKIKYMSESKSVETDDKIVVFGAYNGRNYACSPRAVYEYMLNDERFSDYTFVWFFDDPKSHSYLQKNRNTIVVGRTGQECMRYIHIAKYWIFNFRAVDNWIPKKDQIYVQCWHGTPLKRLGYDITNSDNAMNSVREIRQKYKSDAKRFDYMVSPCDFVTEKFTSAWNLKEAGKEDAILQIGYPRNDFLCNFSENDVKCTKRNLEIENDSRKIILYAPTWRDNQHDAEKGYTYDNPVDFDFLKEQLGEEYIILFRAHYLVAETFNFDEYKGFVYDVSSYDDINDLYVIADILITDYSSVFFDYAILKRPMLFYMYDMEEYRDEMRGFYIDIKELPGPVIRNEAELVAAIKDATVFKGIDEFNDKYNKMNDGHSAERLVNKLLSDRRKVL